MSSALYSAACGSSVLVLQLLSAVKVALMVLLVNHACNSRLVVAYTEQMGLRIPKQLAQTKHRGWAAVSSEEVFREVVQVWSTVQICSVINLPNNYITPTAIKAGMMADQGPLSCACIRTP
eukprot:scaffold296248_cov27-Prasinocladus_malaysianus.AAC.1